VLPSNALFTADPLPLDPKFKGSNPAGAGTGRTQSKEKKVSSIADQRQLVQQSNSGSVNPFTTGTERK
jgi:hypothetical protein